MTTLQVKAEHVDSTTAREQVLTRYGVDELDDAVAVTVASWYQSPGTVGRHLAALASGAEVDFDDLLADIRATRDDADTKLDQTALDMLATWAVQRTNAGYRSYRPAEPAFMRYASVVFLQGDEATEVLQLIERRGEAYAMRHLQDYYVHDADPFAHELYGNPPNGGADRLHFMGDYILSYSHHWQYVGLVRRVAERP